MIEKWSASLLGAAVHAAVIWGLVLIGLHLGQAVGVVIMFYLALVPCSILLSALMPGFWVLAAIPVAGWLAWGAVMHPGPADDGSEQCIDKQGTHAC